MVSKPQAQLVNSGPICAQPHPRHPSPSLLPRWRQSLVLAILGSVLLTIGTTTYFSYRYARRLAIDNVQDNALAAIQHRADAIDRWAVERLAELEEVARNTQRYQHDLDTLNAYVEGQESRLSHFKSLRVQSNFAGFPSERAIAQAIATNTPTLLAVEGTQELLAIAPLPGANHATAALVGVLDRAPLTALIDRPAGLPLLLQARETPLVQSASFPARPEVADLVDGKHALTLNHDLKRALDRQHYYIARLPLQKVDWTLVLAVPRQDIEAQLQSLNLLAIAVGVLLVTLAAVAVQLVWASERARALAAQEGLLNRLTGRIRASLDLDEIMQATVAEVAKLLELNGAAFGWYDPNDRAWQTWWEDAQKPLSQQLGHFEPTPNWQQRLEKGKPLHLQVTARDRRESYYFLPVACEQQLQGYLILVKTNPWQPKAAEQQLLQGVVNQLAIAIAQSRLYIQSEQQVKRLASALDRAALVAITDASGAITHINDAFCDLCGYTRDELLGRHHRLLKLRNPSSKFLHEVYLTLQRGQVWKGEMNLAAKSGADYWLDTTIFPFITQKGIAPQYLAVFFDITQRQRAEAQLRHDAFYDKLTGLPNRALLMQRLNAAIAKAQGDPQYRFALLFFDLDRFKTINDSLGHLTGDRLLIEVGDRLRSGLHPGDLVARFGGDEFIILLEERLNRETPQEAAAGLLKSLKAPFSLADYDLFVAASIGIAFSHNAYQDAEDVLRDADLALYHAKSHNPGSYAVFDQTMRDRALDWLQLERDLRQALDLDTGLSLYYQPIVDLQTKQIKGFEALLRWQHPQRGWISPAEFIPLAEETQLILPLGDWVLTQACQQIAIWQRQFPATPVVVSVNLSGIQLAQANLIETLDWLYDRFNLQPGWLKLEITESVMMANLNAVKVWLEQLQHRHIQVSLDDFGTGYSSLRYLSSLPINTLKIDRSFVQHMHCVTEQKQIVQAIVTLAHNLGMDAIAEGIELEAHVSQLQSLGCEYGQGYYFAKPLGVEEATALLKQQ